MNQLYKVINSWRIYDGVRSTISFLLFFLSNGEAMTDHRVGDKSQNLFTDSGTNNQFGSDRAVCNNSDNR